MFRHTPNVGTGVIVVYPRSMFRHALSARAVWGGTFRLTEAFVITNRQISLCFHSESFIFLLLFQVYGKSDRHRAIVRVRQKGGYRDRTSLSECLGSRDSFQDMLLNGAARIHEYPECNSQRRRDNIALGNQLVTLAKLDIDEVASHEVHSGDGGSRRLAFVWSFRFAKMLTCHR